MTARRRILVTGAGGYIGRHVVRALLDEGHDVVAVGRRLDPRSVDSRASLISADIFTLEDPLETFGRPDTCVHLAWESGFAHASIAHMANLSGHFEFLRRLIDAGLQQLVVAGTIHEVGYFEGAVAEDVPTAPQSLYGVAKDSLRRALAQYTLTTATVFQWLRCFYIYGDDEHSQSVFSKISEAAARGQASFPFTSGSRQFDFIAVERLAEQITAVALQRDVQGIVHCGSGAPVQLRAQAERYLAENGLTLTLDFGAYADRPYESPGVWANTAKITSIMDRHRSRKSSS